MEKIKVEDAVGMTLLHDITGIYPGFKGALFKRGYVIKKGDVRTLLDIGKQYIYAGDADNGMIHEEDAARRLSELSLVEGCHYEGPSEGKMVLVSDKRGMFKVDTELLARINRIKDITISTLPDHYKVEPGARLASMRIVPLFTEEEHIEKAEELCKGKKLLDLLQYKHKKVGIIITGSEIYHGRIEDRFEQVLRKKMTYFPADIVGVKICDDDIDMIVESAGELLESGADLLMFTGGMSVDPDDLTPGAIRKLGADILSYGLPAQPGNMTLIAYLGDIPIIGVPGAAVSLPVTMLDVILPQVFTGLRFTVDDIINMGDGGLCQLCTTCHFPNCTFGKY